MKQHTVAMCALVEIVKGSRVGSFYHISCVKVEAGGNRQGAAEPGIVEAPENLIFSAEPELAAGDIVEDTGLLEARLEVVDFKRPRISKCSPSSES